MARALAARVGRRIRERREITAEMTQSDLARAAKVSQATLSRVEAGLYPPRLRDLLRICRALDTTASELLEGIR